MTTYGILNDTEITELANSGMIAPFAEGVKRPNTISYGVSSFGYDMRIANKWRIFTDIHGGVVDPKSFDNNLFVEKELDIVIIPPHSFVLGVSVEYFRMPDDVMAVCVGKSTLARCGLIVNVTPIEPAWEGYITIEVSNTTPLPAKLYANEGIAQLMFFRGNAPRVNYRNKGGKYQGQVGITLPRVDGV